MTTDDIKRRFEYAARLGKYHVEEWLVPSASGGLRVAATMMVKGNLCGFGLRWDGDKIGDLADRCMALDYAMARIPAWVEQGKVPLWHRQEGDVWPIHG